MSEDYNIDLTGLTPEMAETITKMSNDYKQSIANLTAVTDSYNKAQEELNKAKDDIVALKAANMALALTGGAKKQTAEEVLADMFKLGG